MPNFRFKAQAYQNLERGGVHNVPPPGATQNQKRLGQLGLKKRKWFLNCSYNPHKNQIFNHLECLNRLIDEYNTYHENFIFIGDSNKGVEESQMENFCNINCLESLI